MKLCRLNVNRNHVLAPATERHRKEAPKMSGQKKPPRRSLLREEHSAAVVGTDAEDKLRLARHEACAPE